MNQNKLEYMPGKLHQHLTYEQYAAQPGIRASDLKGFMRSPAHYQAAKRKGGKENDALRFGKLVHSILENGEKFRDTIVVQPYFVGKTKDGKESTRSKEALDKKAEWYAALKPGVSVCTEDELYDIIGISESIGTHRLLSRLLKEGMRETSLFVEDPDTGLILQARPDFIADLGYIIDFKTTRDASRGFFYNEIFSTRYHSSPFYALSMAHYCHCAKIAGLKRPDLFTFIAIEKEDPWGIKVYEMDIGCIGVGEQWREHLTKQFAECIKTDLWPCYEEKAEKLEPPQYADLPPMSEENPYA